MAIFKKNKNKESLLRFVFESFQKDPLLFAYNHIGILNYQNEIISGEKFLIDKILPKYISGKEHKTIFDVGANVGNYSKNLAHVFPNATVYAFEPNKNSYQILEENLNSFQNVKPYNFGFSDKEKISKIYTYSYELDSQHASIYREVFQDIHVSEDFKAIPIKLIRLDDFCDKWQVESIDFLKIDTEGNEFEVLNGALEMINRGRIKIIQFEFNEMNIISRVFLRDFYKILKDFHLYRLKKDSLLPLFKYSTSDEIFKFQNLIAIHKNV